MEIVDNTSLQAGYPWTHFDPSVVHCHSISVSFNMTNIPEFQIHNSVKKTKMFQPTKQKHISKLWVNFFFWGGGGHPSDDIETSGFKSRRTTSYSEICQFLCLSTDNDSIKDTVHLSDPYQFIVLLRYFALFNAK